MNRIGKLAVLGLVVVVSACGAEESENPITSTSTSQADTTTTPAPAGSSTTSPTSLPAVTGEVPDDVIEAMLQDAASRSGVAESELDIVRSEYVEWPDGSLGCAEPGQFYTQAIVPGYWVEIEGPEQVYDYRSDIDGNFSLCERPGPPDTLADR